MINLLKYENIVLDFDGVILDANKQRKKNMKFVLDKNLNQELSKLTYDYFSKNSGVSRNVKLRKFIKDELVLKRSKSHFQNKNTLDKIMNITIKR